MIREMTPLILQKIYYRNIKTLLLYNHQDDIFRLKNVLEYITLMELHLNAAYTTKVYTQLTRRNAPSAK